MGYRHFMSIEAYEQMAYENESKKTGLSIEQLKKRDRKADKKFERKAAREEAKENKKNIKPNNSNPMDERNTMLTEAGNTTSQNAKQEVVSTATEKKVKSARSKFNHSVNSVGGFIDTCVEAGTLSIAEIMSKYTAIIGKKLSATRIKLHMKHCKESHASTVELKA